MNTNMLQNIGQRGALCIGETILLLATLIRSQSPVWRMSMQQAGFFLPPLISPKRALYPQLRILS